MKKKRDRWIERFAQRESVKLDKLKSGKPAKKRVKKQTAFVNMLKSI